MQSKSHTFLRHAFVAACALIFGGCNSDPALLAELSGRPARELTNAFKPAQPVLVARADEDVVAVVFSENRLDLTSLLDELLVDEVEGCGRGGWFGRKAWLGREGPVLCCDRAKGIFALNTERGWLYTGEHCGSSDVEERSALDDPDGGGVEYVKVDPELSQLLEDLFGIDYRFMTLAEVGGTPRALVNGPLPSEELRPEGPPLRSSGLDAPSQVILASHKQGVAGGCVWRRDLDPSCSIQSSDGRCRKRYQHVYYQDSGSNRWCEWPPTCKC
jgi:hypothetical protein